MLRKNSLETWGKVLPGATLASVTKTNTTRNYQQNAAGQTLVLCFTSSHPPQTTQSEDASALIQTLEAKDSQRARSVGREQAPSA